MVAWWHGALDFQPIGPLGIGGDCSQVLHQLQDVQHIYSTNHAFAALKAGGSVVSWGAGGERYYDVADDGRIKWPELGFSEIQTQLIDVQNIYSTGTAFAALKADGSVVS